MPTKVAVLVGAQALLDDTSSFQPSQQPSSIFRQPPQSEKSDLTGAKNMASRLSIFFAELKRRKVYRSAVPALQFDVGPRCKEALMRWSALLLLLLLATSPPASAQTGAGRILFTNGRGRERDIFVMDADGSNQMRLTSGNDAAAPVWSPNGCQIVFRRGVRDIYVMDADGSRILFHGSGTGSSYRDLFIVNVDGSNLIKLTNNTAPDWDWEPSWSPDGSKILFESRREPRGIYVMNADGTGAQRLSAGRSPTWSPDGSRIAFVSADQGHSDIVVMNADGTNVTPLTDGSWYSSRFSWSPDGSRIAFETISEDGDDVDVLLEVMNADGENRSKLADQVMFVMGGAPMVSWSPDGSRVVFVRTPLRLSEMGRAGPQAFSVEIYAVDADGSNLTRLTTGGMSAEPAWSPTARCERGS